MGIFSKKAVPPPPPPPPPPTQREIARQYKRDIDRCVREIDREKAQVERQERQAQISIKKFAKDGEMEAARIHARHLVKTRQTKTKMVKMKAQLEGMSMQLTSMSTMQNMATVMGKAVQSMNVMNKHMDLPGMKNIAREYEQQLNKAGLTMDMMDDAMDDMWDNEETESEEVVDKVLEELVLEISGQIGNVPSMDVPGASGVTSPAVSDDITARLNNLK